jgi:riboflavin kinase/FMN adenylyltransferase
VPPLLDRVRTLQIQDPSEFMVLTPRPGTAARGFTIWRSNDPLPAALRGAIVAIGNFDGMHRGHQQLVALARQEAERHGRPSAVLTFDPHPRAFFQPDASLFRLTPEPVKEKIFAALGLDIVFVRRFDAALAATKARAFVIDLLIGELAASGLVVGSNFHFGRGREGTPEVLRDLATEGGIGCTIVDAVGHLDEDVSSSRIRAALCDGDVATANQLLGYRWFVQGEVVHGEKRGRELGYPTANLRLDPGCTLRHGIYAVRVAVAPGVIHDGVASFGRRPTFDDGPPLLETFIFDFAGDLYGRTIEVEFAGWIRGEARFDSAEALVVQMDDDSSKARAMLARPLEADIRSLIG